MILGQAFLIRALDPLEIVLESRISGVGFELPAVDKDP